MSLLIWHLQIRKKKLRTRSGLGVPRARGFPSSKYLVMLFVGLRSQTSSQKQSGSFLRREDVFRFQRPVRPVLHFKNDRAGLQHFQRMPLSRRNMDPVLTRKRVQQERFGLVSRGIVKHHPDFSAQEQVRFCGMHVPVYGK